MSTDIQSIKQTEALRPSTFDELIKYCEYISKSNTLPVQYKDNPHNIFVAIQFGYEVGYGPMQSLQSIYVVNGIPTLYGDALIGIAKGHPEFEYIKETFNEKDEEAICEVKRKDEPPCIRKFSAAQARRAKLYGKPGPWSSYPERMLQMRARGFAIRDSFPDALKGIKPREEVEDYEIIEGKKYKDVTPKEKQEASCIYTPKKEAVIVTETISKEQSAELLKLFSEHDVKAPAFLEHYNIEKVTDLPVGEFDTACAQIKKKAKKNTSKKTKEDSK